MRGYISLFTKAILLIALLSSSIIVLKAISDYKYNYYSLREYYIENWLSAKGYENIGKEQKLVQIAEVSCINEKSFTREFYLEKNITIKNNIICMQNCTNSTVILNNSTIKSGTKKITVECKNGVAYFYDR